MSIRKPFTVFKDKDVYPSCGYRGLVSIVISVRPYSAGTSPTLPKSWQKNMKI